jgi:prevent-host-death family protein
MFESFVRPPLTNLGPARYHDAVQVNIAQAKATLSTLVTLAEQGQDVVLARNGEPVARIVAFDASHPIEEDSPLRRRGYGVDKGVFEVPDDFDDPLPPEIMRYFT